jgi:hypothetical protein
MMEVLFKLAELEYRIPQNMNVLVSGLAAASRTARTSGRASESSVCNECRLGIRPLDAE